jgi:hypothetical protein
MLVNSFSQVLESVHANLVVFKDKALNVFICLKSQAKLLTKVVTKVVSGNVNALDS